MYDVYVYHYRSCLLKYMLYCLRKLILGNLEISRVLCTRGRKNVLRQLLVLRAQGRGEGRRGREEGALHGVRHADERPGVARNRAAHVQQVAHRINLHDLEVLRGLVLAPHAAGHLLALPHAAGVLALPRGAQRAVVARVTVRGAATPGQRADNNEWSGGVEWGRMSTRGAQHAAHSTPHTALNHRYILGTYHVDRRTYK
jgi:hypothetical protein